MLLVVLDFLGFGKINLFFRLNHSLIKNKPYRIRKNFTWMSTSILSFLRVHFHFKLKLSSQTIDGKRLIR